ncbi:Uma2 family endonuclease [soil metagenome]
MSTAFPIPRYTYSDYERWEGDWELIGGYPYAMSPAPFSKHQLVSGAIYLELSMALRAKKASCNCKSYYGIDWIISDETIVRPDICVVCTPVDLNSHIKVPPVLIVEIFSSSTRLKDRNIKFKLYQECGVKYYPMADPDLKKIETFELIDNIYKETPGKTEFNLTTGCMISINTTDIFIDA